MKRIVALFRISIMALALFLPAARSVAQQPGMPPAPQQAPAPQAAFERSTTMDTIVAFVGVAVVMLIVCYPNRRY